MSVEEKELMVLKLEQMTNLIWIISIPLFIIILIFTISKYGLFSAYEFTLLAGIAVIVGIPIVCIVLGILIMILTKLNIIETDGNWGALEIMKNMSVNGNKTIAYIRVSSQRQVDEGNSLEAQKRRIIQLAQFKGLSIAPEDFLIEKGVSAGIPLWERPMGRVLRRKLLSGEYSNLIAMKLDRLFRITTDMLLTVQEVEDMGVRLLIADLGGEAIDTSTSTGRFMLTIFGGIAEMERGLISERTQEGMDQLKAQNKRFTESIFGWDVDVNGMLIPNWYEQDLIDWMDWQIEVNGMSAAAVARSLNSRGITGKRGGQWQGQSVKRTILLM